MDLFPLWLSLRVALTATALTLVIGIPVALLLARRRFPGKNVLEAAVVLPLVLPPTVLGYYLLLVIGSRGPVGRALAALGLELAFTWGAAVLRSEEHTSELQSQSNLVCRLLLEKKKKNYLKYEFINNIHRYFIDTS